MDYHRLEVVPVTYLQTVSVREKAKPSGMNTVPYDRHIIRSTLGLLRFFSSSHNSLNLLVTRSLSRVFLC